MKSFWRRIRDLFFFLAGVATGITGVCAAIYLYVLKADAERGRRRSGYNDYHTRYGNRPRAQEDTEVPEEVAADGS